MFEYVGPKPKITYTGIEFDQNKEDKFVYLNIAIELIRALSQDYFEDKKYVYTSQVEHLSSALLMSEIRKVCPNIQEIIKQEAISTENEIQESIKRANENTVLEQEDKRTLVKNINLMHDYLVQRAVNKSAYYCLVNALAEILRRDHIDYVVLPMYPKFVHVLHSAQGVLKKGKYPIDTKIDIYKEDTQLLAKLQVINLY